ncbi:hypothetical protein C8Q80DRAFT_1260223 [Daedaleopsis nitida]|nr:hypothetical protein C8Q80DRAFT_1260223 [Daedaleopsis nitida]
MSSDEEWDTDNYDSTDWQTRKSKRRKVTRKRRSKAAVVKEEETSPRIFSIETLLEALYEQTVEDWNDDSEVRDSFEIVLRNLLPELTNAESAYLARQGGIDGRSSDVHLLSRQQASELAQFSTDREPSILARLLAAKSRIHSRVLRRVVLNRDPPYPCTGSLIPLQAPRTGPTANPAVLNALYSIKTTPYESSFLSRLSGARPSLQSGILAVDWETRTPWMELMSDIREHYSLAHPEWEQAAEVVAPITYGTLQPCHLRQVHDLLARVFWHGIDVSDSLEYSPEKCTVIATYKQLVVGAAFLSSPQETYITYLAVRSGWDNSQIATCMLYHLIALNPHKDITLHVSINNPAVLLYNRFGFKAEEFIVGFYEDYLDPNSPQSKNAFRLRLRRW